MPSTLPLLQATRWLDFVGSGRTQPARIACDLPDGNEVECVVKLGGHKESSPLQPVCEAVAALLASDLNLPVAEPLLVEITPDFINRALPPGNTSARERCLKAGGICFGTRQLPAGYAAWPVGKTPGKEVKPVLAELFAFDGLIQNADRITKNSNLLVKGNDLRFFDHDQAFGFLLDLFGGKAVDQRDTYSFLRHHVAYPFLRQDREQFHRLEGAWASLGEDDWTRYRALLPDSWPGKKLYFAGIENHLKNVRSKLAQTFDAINLSLLSQ